eukprot:m51a1_g6728 putative cdp-diacylglycerol--inositol 3-phosphatidyltransferase (214) ;mRNA; r:187844-188817
MVHVLLYYPNLVGYVRIALVFAAFWSSDKCAMGFIACYGLSELMDMLDGHLARRFNQSTLFGAVLDMVTDRSATAMLMVLLGQLYPQYLMLWTSLVLLDLCSHWTQMYSAVLTGKSHKVCKNPILRFYYKKLPLATLCAGNEGCFVLLYALARTDLLARELPLDQASIVVLIRTLLQVAVPLSAIKNFISIVQWADAGLSIIKYETVTSKRSK